MPKTVNGVLAAGLLLGAMAACEPQPAEEAGADAAPEVGAPPDTGAAAGRAGPVVQTGEKEGIGPYLVDANGRSLYLFLADTTGGRATSTCYDACAEAWPPLLAEGGPGVAGPGVQDTLLGTMQRRDGTTQVTYNAWPLYYFAQDTRPGDTRGRDVEGFGAEWYLVTPQGEPAGHGGGAGS